MEMSASPPFRGNRAYIGLGSNLGDPAATLRAAAARLAGLGAVLASSPVYETDPVGLEEQPAFLNAAVLLRTTLAPLDLLEQLLAIEAEFHRERTVRWGPRTLDLDLLWYEGVEMDTARLALPHPRAHEREFVLRPLTDIEPDLPLRGSTARELLAALPAQGVRRTPLALR
jgi:2-amino-4-hydroxy-6-hydroxymethyldihydropteridine diphosphokinase